LRYVNNGDYVNNLIHRSVPGFVIQGGGFRWNEDESKGIVNSYGNISNEFALSNLRGTVAMAKLGNDPNSASNQWFINLADNSANLDAQNGGFAVFAVVAYGMEVVDRIASLRRVNLVNSVGNSAFDTVPTTAALTATQVGYADMVIVKRAYTSDMLPFHCTPNVNVEALAELCSSSVTFPVQMLPSGQVYRATLELVATKPNLVLRVKTGSLVTLAATPVSLAKFDSGKGLLTVPSVRVGGNVFTDVQLSLTDSVKMEFTVTGYK